MTKSEFDYVSSGLGINDALLSAAHDVFVRGEKRIAVRRRYRVNLATFNRTLQRIEDERLRLKHGKS